MPEEGFRLPTSSYEELTKIIKAYGNLREPAVPSQISHLTGQHPTRISANNAFLVAIEIVEGGKKKHITERGRALAHALGHEIPNEIRDNWRSVIIDNEFFQKLISAIRIRKGMEPSTLQAHVAYSAGQPKKPEVMTGAAAVVDILLASGLVVEEGGKIIAVSDDPLIPQNADAPSAQVPGTLQSVIPIAQASIIPAPDVRRAIVNTGVGITIQIQIQCSTQDVAGLGIKLRQLIKDLSNPDEAEQTENNALINWLDTETAEGEIKNKRLDTINSSLFDEVGDEEP